MRSLIPKIRMSRESPSHVWQLRLLVSRAAAW